jgi:hypothetical protein
MESNELRIGNWAEHDGQPVKVKVLHLLTAYRDPEYFAPIPLTPEILEKAGFKKFNNAWVLSDYNPLNHFGWDFTIWDEKGDYRYNSAEFIPELKSLHSLQNLYFALTGTELNINL